MNYLAFDLGGSSGKLMLGTLEGEKISLKTVHRFENHPVETGGHLYWDLFRITEELFAGIGKAIQLTDDHIDGIGFDSFCNDYVLVSKDGTVLAPVFCYRDERTKRCREAMYSIMPQEELYRINGNQMALFNTLNQLHAAKEEGYAWQLEHAEKALFLSDYFIFLLTGKQQTEYTTASVTQMFDWKQKSWSDEILKQYGIRKDLFAPIRLPGTLTGYTTEVFNQKLETKGFPVYTVCQHDTGSAFLAAEGSEETGIISTGTWCIAGVETADPVITDRGFALNVANEGGFPGPHHRLLKNVMGTWIIQEILRECREQGEDLDYAALEEMAKSFQDCQGYIDVDDSRFYEPGDMIRKVKANLRELTGTDVSEVGELIFCVYKSLAFKYRMIFEQLESMTGIPIQRINMIGGGIQSELMCQLTADVCRKPVIAGPADATSLGNLLAQMMASGQIDSIEEGRRIFKGSMAGRLYQPSSGRCLEEQYQAFLEALNA